MAETNGEPAGMGRGLRVLAEPTQTGGLCEDLAMIRRAVKEKWPMAPEVKAQIMARLGEIVVKSSVDVPGAETGAQGAVIGNEAVADRNSVAAANVLRLMVEADRDAQFKAAGHIQAERHHAEGAKVHKTEDVRILMVDARTGQQRIGTAADIRGLMAPPSVAPETVGGVQQPGPESPGDGGATGR